MPLVEIKDFDAFIDNKPFFDQAAENKTKNGNIKGNIQKEID